MANSTLALNAGIVRRYVYVSFIFCRKASSSSSRLGGKASLGLGFLFLFLPDRKALLEQQLRLHFARSFSSHAREGVEGAFVESFFGWGKLQFGYLLF